MAVIVLCGERHKTLDEEFAPQLAAARGAVLAACPTLQKKLDDYLERSKVLAMHDARAQVLGGKLGAVAGAVAGLTAAKAAEYEAAVASKNEPEIARLLREGAAANGKSGGTATRSTLKIPGCQLTVAELTPTGRREGECNLKASRDEKKKRFKINCAANGGVFGCQRFELNVPDTKSGAKADNLGNIINLPLFVIKRRDERRFECKFTEINAMANLAASSAGVDEAEAVVP
jgi:hypothetical protein